MPAGDQQGQEGIIRTLLLKHDGEQVRFHVVNANGGRAPGVRQAPADAGPHQQGPRQARAGGVRHAVYGVRHQPGLPQGGIDQGGNPANVISRRQFRHHAAIGVVQPRLAVQLVRQQPPVRVVDGDAGLVAGSLYPQYAHLPPKLLKIAYFTCIPSISH